MRNSKGRWMSILLILSLSAGLLSSCGSQNGESTAAGEQVTEEAAEATEAKEAGADYSTGTPWIDSNMDGVVTADMPVDLKDDFYLYINKDAILDMKIPEGRPYGGTIMDLVIKNQEDLKDLFLGEAPKSGDGKLAYDLFELMMDWDSRNEQGLTPLKEKTEVIEKIKTLDELTSYYRETPIEKQIGMLWYFGIDHDLLQTNRYIITIGSMDFLLDDSALYSNLTDYGKMKKDAYSKYLTNVLVKLGYSEEEAKQKLDNCFALETMLASTAFTSEERQSPDYFKQANNYFTREELNKAQGKVPILEILEEIAGFPKADKYRVEEPEYVRKLSEIYTEENLPLIRDTLIVRCLALEAWMMDRECYDWDMECRASIEGTTGTLEDEVVFSSRVTKLLQWPVAQMYTETYLKEEDKKRISDMVDEILDTYHDIISEADFLSDDTREKAIKKLEAIDKKILYPDSWDIYSMEGLDFDSKEEKGTLWEAVKAIKKYSTEDEVRRYSKPCERERWEFGPQMMNCMYNSYTNSVYIMGAFAQGDMYNSDMKDEDLYARLGCVIGHEISHAFDSGGAQFDQDGNMIDWWTDQDRKVFQEKNKKLADYFNNMHPWEGQDFHGNIMTGEACADMGGFKAMLSIARKKQNFDYDRFFKSYARLWLNKESLQMAYNRIEDVHPMMYLRCNTTLQQYDEFLDFYGIREGDLMYLAPEDRVAIW